MLTSPPQTLGSLAKVKLILMSICGCRVDNPQQVIDIIIYETIGASLALDSSNTILSEKDQAKFVEHLERYLRREGHQMHKDWGLDHVDQESWDLVTTYAKD